MSTAQFLDPRIRESRSRRAAAPDVPRGGPEPAWLEPRKGLREA